MCRHKTGKCNINGQPGYSWNGEEPMTRQVEPPALRDGDELLYDLPGRCGRGTDSHSFHFRVVKSGGYGMDLLVRHGRGDERFRLSCPAGESFASMSEEDRYWVCQAMYHAIENAREKSHRDTTARWQQAAAEKRIRTRKMPKRDAVKVWIEPAIG